MSGLKHRNPPIDQQQHGDPARSGADAGVERHQVRHDHRDAAAHRHELQRRRRLLRARGPLPHRGHHRAVQEPAYDFIRKLTLIRILI